MRQPNDLIAVWQKNIESAKQETFVEFRIPIPIASFSNAFSPNLVTSNLVASILMASIASLAGLFPCSPLLAQPFVPSTTRPAVLPRDTEYDRGNRLAELEKASIRESSGLAVSRKHSDRFWTHNDSGDESRLFCFDIHGKHLGTSHIKKLKADDWEDMASATIDGEHYLIIGDVGDNLRKRKSCSIILAKEPSNPKKDVKDWTELKFRYESGPLDCEAVGYDPVERQFLLVEKRLSLTARVFAIPLGKATKKAGNRTDVAKQIGIIGVPWITASDISSDGKRMIVGTYQQSYLFTREGDEKWIDALRREPVMIQTPIRKQGETICFGNDGETLYLTSEKRPTPLFEIRKRAENK